MHFALRYQVQGNRKLSQQLDATFDPFLAGFLRTGSRRCLTDAGVRPSTGSDPGAVVHTRAAPSVRSR